MTVSAFFQWLIVLEWHSSSGLFSSCLCCLTSFCYQNTNRWKKTNYLLCSNITVDAHDTHNSRLSGTHLALLVRQTKVSVPHLEAIAELREMHFLDFHSEVSLQTLHHLEKPTEQFQSTNPPGVPSSAEVIWLTDLTHLLLNVYELFADRGCQKTAAMRDGEEPQLL